MEDNRHSDLVRSILQILAVAILIATVFWIVRPFVVASAWAMMIVVATWPLLLGLQAWLGGKRSLAVAVMTVALLLILLVPLYFGIVAIVDNTKLVVDWSKSVGTIALPEPPTWVAEVPVVGERITSGWQQLAAASPEEVSMRVAPYARTLARWFVGQVGNVGLLLVEFLLTVIIAAILYANGETAARAAGHFARRLAGQQGENAVYLAGQAIRGVALGVVVTAIVQSAMVAVGLLTVAVPFAPMLSVIAFLLAIAQIGPVLLLIPIVFWVYSTSGGVWGTGFLVWAVLCCTIDNIIRPLLIKRGADLPLLLVFAGVIGGLVAFGVIGLFIGPVVLAVAYTLLSAWVSQDEASDPEGGQRSPS